MAWIKFEKDLLTDPRVIRMAKTLQFRWEMVNDSQDVRNVDALPAVTLVCGALVRIWSLADTHVDNSDVLPLGIEELNDHIGIPGFCELMPPDWLQPIDEHSVKLPDFHAHNGTEAKRKAVTQKRVAAFRRRNGAALPDQTKTKPDQREESALARAPSGMAATAKTNGGWWKSDAGIDAKGKELGLNAQRGESYPEYKDRIFKHLESLNTRTAAA